MYAENTIAFPIGYLAAFAELAEAIADTDLRALDFFQYSGGDVYFFVSRKTGKVFIQDEDFNLAAINPNTGELEVYHCLYESDVEGFVADLYEAFEEGEIIDADDLQKLLCIFDCAGRYAEAEEVRLAIRILDAYERYDATLPLDELTRLAEDLEALNYKSAAEEVRTTLEELAAEATCDNEDP